MGHGTPTHMMSQKLSCIPSFLDNRQKRTIEYAILFYLEGSIVILGWTVPGVVAYWVVLTWGKLLISGYETQEEAEAEAKRLNDLCLVSPEQVPYYQVVSRSPQGD